MLVSRTNLKLAALECMDKFVVFSHFYGISKKQFQRKVEFQEDILTFSAVEYENPEQALQQKYEDSVKAAVNKLFVLDKAYYKKNREHIIAKLEDFADYVKALNEIDAFLESIES